MRLVCPNCDAEYEVDATAIPLSGRDVQCSNCGHAWFQAHPETVTAQDRADAEQPVADRAAGADRRRKPQADAGGPKSAPDSAPESVSRPEPAPQPAPPAPAAPKPSVTAATQTPSPIPSRTLDETVLAVLREEAEREAAARRSEAAVALRVPMSRTPSIETQTEMPLTQDQNGMSAAVRRIARLRAAEPEPAAAPPPKSRREMLPAIEEINSTLRATSDRTSDADAAIYDSMDDGAVGQNGFRRGFMLLVLLAALIAAVYVMAPMIGDRVPALKAIAAHYVTAVDAARLWLDAELRALIAKLRDLAGGQGG